MLTTVGLPTAPVVPIRGAPAAAARLGRSGKRGAAGKTMRRCRNARLGGVLLATYTMMDGIGVRSGGRDRRHISRR